MEKATSGVLPVLSENLNVASSANCRLTGLEVSASPEFGAMDSFLPPAEVLQTSNWRVFAREIHLDAMSCRTQSASSKSMRRGIRSKTYCLTWLAIKFLNKTDNIDFLGRAQQREIFP